MAYRRLRELIDQGRFLGGERLTETKLARRLGMSRGPIRESLLRLQSEGLLQSRGNRRSRVIMQISEDQNPDELLARYELREQIEGGAARLAAKNMNGWQIDHLAELADLLKKHTEAGNTEERYAAAAEFHHYLISNCGNALLRQIWESHRLEPPRPRTLEFEQNILNQLPSDQRDNPPLGEVVEAIAARDQDRAESLMKKSVRAITEALRKSLRKQSST